MGIYQLSCAFEILSPILCDCVYGGKKEENRGTSKMECDFELVIRVLGAWNHEGGGIPGLLGKFFVNFVLRAA